MFIAFFHKKIYFLTIPIYFDVKNELKKNYTG